VLLRLLSTAAAALLLLLLLLRRLLRRLLLLLLLLRLRLLLLLLLLWLLLLLLLLRLSQRGRRCCLPPWSLGAPLLRWPRWRLAEKGERGARDGPSLALRVRVLRRAAAADLGRGEQRWDGASARTGAHLLKLLSCSTCSRC
jgi:hypothetical protein